ncbi:hypothetical protein RV11_GL000339 [Enterococcus phoeniculicola]|nr:hypothetical protein RV11_GL000339 [Enterococcus phoeniculicola]
MLYTSSIDVSCVTALIANNRIIPRILKPSTRPDQSFFCAGPTSFRFLPNAFVAASLTELLATRSPPATAAPTKLIHNTVDSVLLGNATYKKIPNKINSKTNKPIVLFNFFPFVASKLTPFATSRPIPKYNVNPIKSKSILSPPSHKIKKGLPPKVEASLVIDLIIIDR